MEHLREQIAGYTDEYLVEQYTKYKEDYTPEAVGMLEDEIGKRQINISDFDKVKTVVETNVAPQKVFNLDRDDFVCFDHDFSSLDIQLAITILRDNDIVYFVDNPSSSDSIPLENETSRRFTVEVHKDWVEKAHELLDEHFTKTNGNYVLRYASPRDRLKSFNFHDIHVSEYEAKEILNVDFNDEEKKTILHYGARLLNEVDEIEKLQDKIIFYYDSIEGVTEKLESDSGKLNRYDLLTILEIFQVYCDDSAFPESINDTIAALLSFFIEK